MQKFLKYIVAGLIVLAIVGFMTTYSVRFTEKAVVTTFGKADPDSVRSEPGMGFRWPYPIQSVVKYDTRARFVEALPQTIATKDERQVILAAYITWRVSDPLKFYSLYGRGSRPTDHLREADDYVRGLLSSALSTVSQYRLDELLNATPGKGKLGELETQVKEKLLSSKGAIGAGGALSESGIEVLTMGVYNILMPEAITQNVFDAMKQKRTRIAAEALERGKAESESIKSQAEADAKTIMDFVKQRADTIRAQGDQEAAEYYKRMSESPELAVFLKGLELMREGIGPRATLVWPFSAPGMGVMNPAAVFDPQLNGAPNLFASDLPAAPKKPEPKGDGKKERP